MMEHRERDERGDWDLVEEVGGPAVMETMMRRFYDRLFDDFFVGFFFEGHDKEALIASQTNYLHAHLGGRQGTYQGTSIREAHEGMKIFAGHFDRRHTILKEVMAEFDVPQHVRREWVALDLALRELVIT